MTDKYLFKRQEVSGNVEQISNLGNNYYLGGGKPWKIIRIKGAKIIMSYNND